jgi:hypothetical protein
MYTTTIVSAFLATIAAAAPIDPETTPATPLGTRGLPECKNHHLPTEPIWRIGLNQFCNHFPHEFAPKEKLDYTYTLTDYRGYPIKFVNSMTWDTMHEDGSGPILTVSKEKCFEYMKPFVDGNVGCREGSKKMVVGGKRNIYADQKGAKLWVESRQRLDDKFLPPPPKKE